MEKINKRTVLEEMREKAWHNVYCYSDNYLMTVPKDGMREEWQMAVAKAKIIDLMLDELPGHSRFDEVFQSWQYYRKYVGYIGGWACSATRTENPHPYVTTVEFDLKGFGISDSDTRIFHINHELGINYLLSGEYDIARHKRYDEEKNSAVMITVDNLGYIQEIRWVEEGK